MNELWRAETISALFLLNKDAQVRYINGMYIDKTPTFLVD
ncbi:hypothetical protein B4113_0096 [Geobacillus sp. B4113_201601]|nr:hypothetical protein B4113_0096 [Geobacillus sp. B4113_201601]